MPPPFRRSQRHTKQLVRGVHPKENDAGTTYSASAVGCHLRLGRGEKRRRRHTGHFESVALCGPGLPGPSLLPPTTARRYLDTWLWSWSRGSRLRGRSFSPERSPLNQSPLSRKGGHERPPLTHAPSPSIARRRALGRVLRPLTVPPPSLPTVNSPHEAASQAAAGPHQLLPLAKN